MLIPNISELVRQLQEYRQRAGLSQGDIAWKLGFSLPTVSRWERGICTPDLRAVGSIVDFLRRADSHDEKALIRAVLMARDSRNLWEGEQVRYLAGSRQEYIDTPQMRAAVGTSIRHHLTGLYQDFIEDAGMLASLKARELSSVEVYSGAALATTSIPEGFVQLKRMTFQSQLVGIIRAETHSILIPKAEAPMDHGARLHSWDTLSRPL
jgi:transcriptional regulator with XRE-family HTH domain